MSDDSFVRQHAAALDGCSARSTSTREMKDVTERGCARTNEMRDRIDRIQVVVSALVGLVATVALAALPYVQHVTAVDWYSASVGKVATGSFLACISLALRKPLPRVAIRWTMVLMLVMTLLATSIVVLTYPSSEYGTSILLAFATVFACIVFVMTLSDGRRRHITER